MMIERYQLKKDADNDCFIDAGCANLQGRFRDGRAIYITLQSNFSKTADASYGWIAYNAKNEVVLNDCCNISFSGIELISVNDAMSNLNQLSAMQEANLSEDAKSLVKVGLLDANLTVRDDTLLKAMLVELNFKELAALAKEKIVKAETENSKKNTA